MAIDETTISPSGFEVIAPGDVPAEVTLVLQIRVDGDSQFYDYAAGVVANQRVAVSGLSSCEWYGLRWLPILP